MMNHATSMFVFFYSAVLELCRFIVVPPLLRTNTAAAWNIRERLGPPQLTNNNTGQAVVWVHAASLGEAKLLLQFLEVLEQRNPDDRYVVTATTRAGVEHLERMQRPSLCAVGFLPFDTLPLMRALIRKFNVSPESTMSSISRTSIPSTGFFRSATIFTTPEVSVLTP